MLLERLTHKVRRQLPRNEVRAVRPCAYTGVDSSSCHDDSLSTRAVV